jgi:hypothetical protein
MTKGLDIVFQSLDSEYVLARVIWREQDSGGGTVTLEIPVRNSARRTREPWQSDLRGPSPTRSRISPLRQRS